MYTGRLHKCLLPGMHAAIFQPCGSAPQKGTVTYHVFFLARNWPCEQVAATQKEPSNLLQQEWLYREEITKERNRRLRGLGCGDKEEESRSRELAKDAKAHCKARNAPTALQRACGTVEACGPRG